MNRSLELGRSYLMGAVVAIPSRDADRFVEEQGNGQAPTDEPKTLSGTPAAESAANVKSDAV